MNTQKFIDLLIEYLEIENKSITVDTQLKSLPEYDSLGIMSIISLVDEYFSKTLSTQELDKIETIKDLMELIGKENFTN